MSVYLYDNAIVETFKSIINDDRIYITPAENVIRTIARLNDDDVQFPMISLTRTGTQLQPSHFSMRYDGLPVYADYNNEVMQKLQAMPIRINYQVDIWTRNREENDNLVRELVFYLSTHQAMYVDIPYELNQKHVFTFALDNTIDDNSDIINHKNSGEYFRQTLTAYVDDAYLWKTSKAPTVNVTGIELDVKPSETEYKEKIQILEENDD